ncbi:MAG: hypothetical protein LBK56_12040 [Gracilibacteraceae bacterium]|jgi:hypothetical protein|nr:hypothetical protein [Gracilibacteraceae bacterium]
MENKQLLPFERNRFYVGKLLTSSDFLSEQMYLNNKRRFLNALMFGAGVVCGLGVYNLDDVSVIVESGAAIDGAGREIVLESAVIRKLSSISGFESITGERALLMLRYREESVHPAYSVARGERADAEYEMNRVREGWELFLSEPGAAAPLADTEFLARSELYADGDYAVEIVAPCNVSCGERVRGYIAARKLSETPKLLSIDCTIHAPAFTNDKGEHLLAVKAEDVAIERGEEERFGFVLEAQGHPAPESFLLGKSSLLRFTVDGEPKPPAGDLMLKVNVVDMPVHELLEQAVGRVNLEATLGAADADAVCLAELLLQRSKNDYIVDKIEERKNYIRRMGAEKLRREYASYFTGRRSAAPMTAEDPPAPVPDRTSPREPYYATGVCEIPLGSSPRKGEVFFSDEIMHGLGSGNIHVDVGFDYIVEAGREGRPEKMSIYGDAELFAGENPQIAFARTAVKVYAERGSFVIAASLTRQTNFAVIVLRWVAAKLPFGDDKLLPRRTADMSVAALTPTIVMGMRETHFFAVTFKNMEPCTLTYELTEKNSGQITTDGVYTSPSREGVYEIRISCADMPAVSSYAYAVVKKELTKENEDERT